MKDKICICGHSIVEHLPCGGKGRNPLCENHTWCTRCYDFKCKKFTPKKEKK